MILAVDITQAIVAILNFTIPALIVFGVTYYLVQSFLNEQRTVRIIELKKEQANALTPIKLQAYERLTLLLDRGRALPNVQRNIINLSSDYPD